MVCRSQLVADPNPPPPQRAYGAPSMPGIIEPIVGMGDSLINAKDAEKLAALESCVRLSARGLFTSVRFYLLYYNNLPLTPHSIEGKRSIRTDSFEYPTCCSLIFLPVRKDFIPHSIPLLNRLPPLTLNLNPRHSTHPRLLPTVNLQLLYPLPFQQLTNNRMDQLRWYPLEVATMGNGSL